jgi:hypothetical protein
MTTPYVVTLQGPETTRVSLSVSSDPATNNTTPTIGGYISGQTLTGTFITDLKRIVLSDSMTGRKPRQTSVATVNSTSVSMLAAGFGQTAIALVLVIPFTFVDPNTQEATRCSSSPFITTQAGAEFLQSDPCYTKGSGPGHYSLACLQGVFASNGCSNSGLAYPNSTTTANTLMTNQDGTFKSLNDIANLVYSNAVATSTGISISGAKLSINEWSNASVFCTGTPITSPCDTETKNSGPLTNECLAYLWNNEGSGALSTGQPNPLGSTYSLGSMASSLFSNKNNASRFCQASGTLSPMDVNNNPNSTAISYWQKQGGVNSVKAKMANIHLMANREGLSDAERETYFTQCYGSIPLAKRPTAGKNSYQYQGCYNDQGNRALPAYLRQVGSMEECKAAAIEGQYNTFGLQYYGECWAGNNTDWDKYGKINPDNSCGNLGTAWNNKVYTNMTPDFPPKPTPPFDNYKTYRAGDKVTYNGSTYSFNAYIGAAGYGPGNYPQVWTKQ